MAALSCRNFIDDLIIQWLQISEPNGPRGGVLWKYPGIGLLLNSDECGSARLLVVIIY